MVLMKFFEAGLASGGSTPRYTPLKRSEDENVDEQTNNDIVCYVF